MELRKSKNIKRLLQAVCKPVVPRLEFKERMRRLLCPRDERGLTLVELLIILTILAILAAVVIPYISTLLQK